MSEAIRCLCTDSFDEMSGQCKPARDGHFKIVHFEGRIAQWAAKVPVESQCFGNYFYSKENAAEAEQGFQWREVSYCKFVDELRAGKEPSRISHGDLFLNMADLHLRNAIHKNLTKDEGLEAYNVVALQIAA